MALSEYVRGVCVYVYALCGVCFVRVLSVCSVCACDELCVLCVYCCSVVNETEMENSFLVSSLYSHQREKGRNTSTNAGATLIL